MTRLFLIILFTILVACKKEDHPPVVYTYPVTDVNLHEASTGGYINDNNGSEIIRRGMIWNTSGRVSMSNYEGITEEGAGSGEFNSRITGLYPGKKYYTRAFATNHAETGYGQEIDFTTNVGSIQIRVTVDFISCFSVYALCYIDTDGTESIEDRGLVWNLRGNNTPDPTLENHTGNYSKGAGDSSFLAEVTGLSSNTYYLLRAYAITSIDTFYTETVLFQTLHENDCNP